MTDLEQKIKDVLDRECVFQSDCGEMCKGCITHEQLAKGVAEALNESQTS